MARAGILRTNNGEALLGRTLCILVINYETLFGHVFYVCVCVFSTSSSSNNTSFICSCSHRYIWRASVFRAMHSVSLSRTQTSWRLARSVTNDFAASSTKGGHLRKYSSPGGTTCAEKRVEKAEFCYLSWYCVFFSKLYFMKYPNTK